MSPRIADPLPRAASPGVVSIDVDDLDAVEDLPAAKALSNLAAVHQLPRLEHIYRVDRHDGHTIVQLAVPLAAAEQWRAALGAPPFDETRHPHSSQWRTERSCWFGATIRLSYSTF
jgi:hypothetical protein